MKPFMYGLLGVSLAANVALLALTRSAAPDTSTAHGLAAFNARLDALIGTEAAEAYRNDRLGRDFRTHSRPRLTPQSLVPQPPGG